MNVFLERDFWIYFIVTLLAVIVGVYILSTEIHDDHIVLAIFWIAATFLSLALFIHGFMSSTATTRVLLLLLYLLVLLLSLIWTSAPQALPPIVALLLLNLLLYSIPPGPHRSRGCLLLAVLMIWFALAVYVLIKWNDL